MAMMAPEDPARRVFTADLLAMAPSPNSLMLICDEELYANIPSINRKAPTPVN